MSEDLELTPGGAGLDRRDFIRRSAIVGGMVWAAPMIQSLGSPAFAFGTPDEGENGDRREISYIAFALYNNGSGIFKFEAGKEGTVPSSLDSAPQGCQTRYDEEELSTEGEGGTLGMVTVDRPDLYTWTINPADGYGVSWVLVKGGNTSGDDGSQCTYLPGPYPKDESVSVSTHATTP